MSSQLPILTIRDGQLELTFEGAMRLAEDYDGVMSYGQWWSGIQNRYERLPSQYREVTDRWRAYIDYVKGAVRSAEAGAA